MLVAILHNEIPPNAREDERDVLVQARAVGRALQELGHQHELVSVGLEVGTALESVRRLKPQLLFNLVESFAGSDRLASLSVAAFEQLGLPITGSNADVLWLSNNKILSKERMLSTGLPTPSWCELLDGRGLMRGPSPSSFQATQYILKPISEHASLGMDASSVVQPSSLDELVEMLRLRSGEIGRWCFAEQFIDGREFNISLLAHEDGCEVLPLAETDFSDFQPGQPRIVDYRAKWDESSFAYHHTPRKFLRSVSEPQLAGELGKLARQCWSVFGLQGYVRVDFRVDQAGRPWILEVNTNPCISPDAGYAAALNEAGIPYMQAIDRILTAAIKARRASEGYGTSDAQVAQKPLNHRGKPGGGSGKPPSDEVPNPEGITWRYEVCPSDPAAIRDLITATGFFYVDEAAVAEELVTARLANGDASEYFFVIAERANRILGYACYGPIACTRDSYDLYWIAVHPDAQRSGLGRQILRESEKKIFERGGRRVYIETSNRPQYRSTRAFYLRCGYECQATLHEFYGPGDDKVIYAKAISD